VALGTVTDHGEGVILEVPAGERSETVMYSASRPLHLCQDPFPAPQLPAHSSGLCGKKHSRDM
jgi:hypothetical protein